MVRFMVVGWWMVRTLVHILCLFRIIFYALATSKHPEKVGPCKIGNRKHKSKSYVATLYHYTVEHDRDCRYHVDQCVYLVVDRSSSSQSAAYQQEDSTYFPSDYFNLRFNSAQ